MSINGPSNPGAAYLAGLALIDAMQRQRRTTQGFRQFWAEMDTASGEVAKVFNNLEKAGQEADRKAAYFGAAMSVLRIAKEAKGPGTDGLGKDADSLWDKMWQQLGHEGGEPRWYQISSDLLGGAVDVNAARMNHWDQANQKAAAGYRKQASAWAKASDTLQEMVEGDNEVMVEVAKIGAIFVKPG